MKNLDEVRSTYKGVELSKFLMEEYVHLGGVKALEDKYCVSKVSIYGAIRKHIDEIMGNDNELYESYMNTMDKSVKRARASGVEKCRQTMIEIRANEEYQERFTSKELEKLPSKIHYNDLVDFTLKYSTGDLTGNDFIRMAAQKGIQVFDIIKGKEKTIKI
ncbi:MAG: hypothetical protein RR851_13080 [Clostridium sp.]